jgi:1,4-dihydroxy-6-naphthoate synthase
VTGGYGEAVALSLAISPCPNDTFAFHALVHGLVPGAPRFEVTYADVDVTNTAVARGEFDIAKISFAAWARLRDGYELLPCGGALGRGCGPLLLTRSTGSGFDLATASVAIPGELTTAYLLFRLWADDVAPQRLEVVPFDEIMPGVAAGRYDAGLVIHEARFTYPRYGLRQVVDLGQWWESDTGLPIPLGAIVARRGTVDPDQAAQWVRASVRAAWADPAASRNFVRSHAQELDPDVIDRHIALYVNEFTADLGAEGRAAVDELLSRATRIAPV